MKPIIKWPGGKSQLLEKLLPLIQPNLKPNSTFFEPFAGGLAVTLALQHTKTVVNDLNSELINLYRVVRDAPEELILALQALAEKHSNSFYYEIRDLDREDDFLTKYSTVIRAARTIYLNKTCFNGLYRVNKKGHFNSPIGRSSSGKLPDIVQEDLIREVSNFLKTVQFQNVDYRKAVETAKVGDVVYLDPPFDQDESISSEGFVGYQKEGWTRQNLVELKRLCDELVFKGCKVIISNNDTEFVRKLFTGYKFKEIEVKRSINRDGNKRKGKELIIYN